MGETQPRLRILVVFAVIAIAFGSIMIAFSRTASHGPSWGFFKFDGPTGNREERSIERKFPFPPGGTLTLRTETGDVIVDTDTADTLSVTVDMRGTESQLSDFSFEFSSSSQGVEITGKRPHGIHFNFFNNFSVRYRIKMPRKASVDVQTSGGDILVADVDGPVKCNTSGGDIDVGRVAGTVDLGTSGGNVRLKSAGGNTSLRTSGGDIVADTLLSSATIKTSGGNITVGCAGSKLVAHTSGGSLDIGAGLSTSGIDATTSGGDIVATLPPTLNATINAESSGGDVKCDLPIMVKGKISGDEIHGELNKGGVEVRLHTSGGSVHVKSSEGAAKK